MIPMALMGDRLPALAPFATASAVRKRGTPARVAAAIAIGIRSATAMIAPGPTRRQRERGGEQQHRQEPGLSAGEPHRAVRQAVEGAVRLRQREQQRDAGEGEEERRRKAGGDLLGLPASREGADQPGERHGGDAHIELRRHRQRDGDQQRDEREDGGVHAAPDGAPSIISPVSTVQLQTLDIVIVAAYLLGITALGLYVSRGVKTTEDFFLAGRSLPWWIAGLSLVVSDIGAKDMIGLAGDAYRYGIVMMNFDFVGCTFAVLIAAFLFMPLFWDAGITTIPEYLGRRYNMTVRTFFAVVWSLFMVGTVATILVSAASMFEGLLGWSFWFSVGLTSVLVGIFTTSGGAKAVAVTDAVSCVVLIGGAALLCGIGLWHVGGPGAMIERVSALPWTGEHFELLPSASHPAYPWPAVVLGLGLVLGPAYWVGNQAIIQRTLGTKTEADARASYVFAATIKLVFPVLLVLPGLLALALFAKELGPPGQGWDGNRVLPKMIAALVPTGALGLLMGAFVASVMANLEAYISSASTLLVTDLYRPHCQAGRVRRGVPPGGALAGRRAPRGRRPRELPGEGPVRIGVRGVPDLPVVLPGRAVLAPAVRAADTPGDGGRRRRGRAGRRGDRRHPQHHGSALSVDGVLVVHRRIGGARRGERGHAGQVRGRAARARIVGALMSIEPGAILVILLYVLALYVILVVAPRLSPSLRVPVPWWRSVKFWGAFVAVTQIIVYALFS